MRGFWPPGMVSGMTQADHNTTGGNDQHIATAPGAGTAQIQGDLWSARARDYAEIMGIFRPLYESALGRPELARASSSLDVGCGPGLAATVFAPKTANVSGIDASAGFIEIARERLTTTPRRRNANAAVRR